MICQANSQKGLVPFLKHINPYPKHQSHGTVGSWEKSWGDDARQFPRIVVRTGTSAPAPLKALGKLRSQVVEGTVPRPWDSPHSKDDAPRLTLPGPQDTAVLVAHIPASGRTGGCPPSPPPCPLGPSGASASSAQSPAQTAGGAGGGKDSA